jgi:hypothetical protein
MPAALVSRCHSEISAIIITLRSRIPEPLPSVIRNGARRRPPIATPRGHTEAAASRSRTHAAERTRAPTRNERPIRELIAAPIGRDRKMSIETRCRPQLFRIGPAESLMRPAEIISSRVKRSATETSVLEMHTADRIPIAPDPAASSPPRLEAFVRRKRYPSKSHARSEESDQSRTPNVHGTSCARPPTPAVRSVPEPTPVMIRSPTPGRGINPRPSVIALPGPFSIAVRRPVGTDVSWFPNLAVLRRNPRPVAIQVLGTAHFRTDQRNAG